MKTFTKQSLTKRMMAILLSLLFAVSSFTIAGFVPTMDAFATDVFDNANLKANWLTSSDITADASGNNRTVTTNNVTWETVDGYYAAKIGDGGYVRFTNTERNDNAFNKNGTGTPLVTTICFMAYTNSTGETPLFTISGDGDESKNLYPGAYHYFNFRLNSNGTITARNSGKWNSYKYNCSNWNSSEGWHKYYIRLNGNNNSTKTVRVVQDETEVYNTTVDVADENFYRYSSVITIGSYMWSNDATDASSKSGSPVNPTGSFDGAIRDFRIYSASEGATDLRANMQAIADETKPIDPNQKFEYDFDFKNLTTMESGTGAAKTMTDTSGDSLQFVYWGTANKTDGQYVRATDITIATKDDISPKIKGEHWIASVNFKAESLASDNVKASALGIGTSSTSADLCYVSYDGHITFNDNSNDSLCANASNFSFSNNWQGNNITLSIEYINGIVSVYYTVDTDSTKNILHNINISSNATLKQKFDSGIGGMFIGSPRKQSASWTTYTGDYTNAAGVKTSPNTNFVYFYNLHANNITGRVPVPDPEVPTRPTYDSVNVSELKTAIDNFETTFTNIVKDSSTSALGGLYEAYKTYMQAKAYYDATNLGQEINTITQAQVDQIKNDLSSKTSALATGVKTVAMKDKTNMYKSATPFKSAQYTLASSQNKNITNSKGSTVGNLIYNTDANTSDSYWANVVYFENNDTYDSYLNSMNPSNLGNHKLLLNDTCGVYRGSQEAVIFPVIMNTNIGSTSIRYMAVAESVDSNNQATVKFGDFWLCNDWDFSTNEYCHIIYNSNRPAYALCWGYQDDSSTANFPNTRSYTNNHYANQIKVIPNKNTILAKITNLPVRFGKGVNDYFTRDATNGQYEYFYILNYEKFIKDINSSWSTFKDMISDNGVVSKDMIAGSDVDNAKILNYLYYVDQAANYNPYSTSGTYSSFSNAKAQLQSGETIYNNVINAKNALESNDQNYKTLRTYIDSYGKYNYNDQCYSAYEAYKTARENALNQIVAPSKNTSNNYNYVQITDDVANTLKSTYNTMIASAKAHTYTNTGVLNQVKKTVDYKCLVNDADSHVDHVDASAYISSIDTLISEIAKTQKYKADVIEHAQGVLESNVLTNNKETESGSDVYIAHADIVSTIDTYTEKILTEISNMRKNRDGLNDLAVSYSYEKDNETIKIDGSDDNGIKTVEVKYGDLVTDSGYELGKDEHIVKWTIQAEGERPRTLNYNPTTNVNYEATKNANIICYIETDNSTADKPHTVQFIDKAGRVRAIAYAKDSTVFTVDANGVKADGQLVYEGDKLPYYQIRGFKIASKEYVTGSTFNVTGDTNIYTIYEESKPITITRPKDSVITNSKFPDESTYQADWDEKITVKDTSPTADFYWFINGVLLGRGSYITFRANSDAVITKEQAGDNPEKYVIIESADRIAYNTDVTYFEYNKDLNRVTLVNTFVALNSSYQVINDQITEAGVVLSTTASDAETIAKVGKKFASTKKTDTGNQVHIAVSRTANTDFTMHALPYIVINGKTYYGNTVKTINYKA